MAHTIFDKTLFFLDGDGTIYLGNRLLPGAKSLLNRLKQLNKPYYICTNNSSKPPSDYIKQYNQLGLSIHEDNLLTSTQPALLYCQSKKISRLYIIATKAVIAYIESQGITHDEHNPEAILLTYDTELTYKEIKHTVMWLNKGLPYFATHPDQLCPTDQGMLPDIGTYITMFETATRRSPDIIFGKPNTMMIQPILNQLGLSLNDAIMIGDRLYTDIKMGQGNDLTTVLTLQGETTAEMATNSKIKADFIIHSLTDLL
jgi:HAD superfamily hydrolase (TIGR01450 family)